MKGEPQQAKIDDLPYHRMYGRSLVIFVIVCIPVSRLLFPGGESQLGFGVRFVPLCIAMLWCPVLMYCGVRTRNLIDFVAGTAGVATLFYWIPDLFWP